MASETLYIGVDPGVSGALAAVASDGEFVVAYDTPTITAKTGGKTKSGNARKKKQYNEHAMVQYLLDFAMFRQEGRYQLMAVVEDVHSMPKDSKPGCFTFGESKGIWRGMLAALQIPYTMISPATWRTSMVGTGTDKAASIVVAQRLFPKVDLGKKKDHNRAEALLLAEYLKRRITGAVTVETKKSRQAPRTILQHKRSALESTFGLS